MADREDDGLMRQAAHILATLVHELADHGIVGALVDDAFFDVTAIEVEFVGSTP